MKFNSGIFKIAVVGIWCVVFMGMGVRVSGQAYSTGVDLIINNTSTFVSFQIDDEGNITILYDKGDGKGPNDTLSIPAGEEQIWYTYDSTNGTHFVSQVNTDGKSNNAFELLGYTDSIVLQGNITGSTNLSLSIIGTFGGPTGPFPFQIGDIDIRSGSTCIESDVFNQSSVNPNNYIYVEGYVDPGSKDVMINFQFKNFTGNVYKMSECPSTGMNANSTCSFLCPK